MVAHSFRHLISTALGLCGIAVIPATATASIPHQCSDDDLKGAAYVSGVDFKIDDDTALPFDAAVLEYPYGSLNVYGFQTTFVIGTDGKVECASIKPAYQSTGPAINPVRSNFLKQLGDWKITPYSVDGKPVRVVGQLSVDEVERPQRHIPKPDGDPALVTITQDSVPDFASYSPYHVELHGDGTAIYMSRERNDPLGPQTYHVDAQAVQDLIKKAEEIDYWSLRDTYRSINTFGDRLSYDRVNITIGGQTKSLTDQNGKGAGLSSQAGEFFWHVMAAANIDFWQSPTHATLAQLKANGYDFTTELAERLLLQMVQNPRVKEETIFELIALGAPLYSANDVNPLIEVALRSGRTELAKHLIAQNALLTDGKPDQDKINRSFYAAVESCNVEAIDLILPYTPDSTYTDDYMEEDKKVSVIRLLGGGNGYLKDCVAAAKKLIGLGYDAGAAAADGSTLLHSVGLDIDLAVLLIDNGADVNAVDTDGWSPLAKSFDEDVSLLLLAHGADPRAKLAARALRFNIKNNHWAKVETWLIEHGYQDVLTAQSEDEDGDK
ncbi:DUF6438 domain-containing protein [Asticcacaulis sp. 201]|uniref:DUF6438 domain-containing protein n=1 Tax=Asticcacaulis sp. 201 TaxID=3028787 RepID=UPI0029162304|nr:DUF6438 domain-containing protein [Asticcacaulis sp. 201]MDV6330000.1 DUF6438 domain-containing protein [Asticcacaulis sp. 201]